MREVLPISVESETAPNLRVRREQLQAFPPLAPYFVLGLLAFAAAPVPLLLASPAAESGLSRHPLIRAGVHLYALGWGTAVALGALQQMTAVLFGTVLFRPRLAAAAFPLFAAGLLSLLFGFLKLAPAAFVASGVLLPAGVALVLANVLLTMRSGRASRRALLVRPYVVAAASYLALTVLAGASLASNLATGWLGTTWQEVFLLHVTFGAAGWFLMLVSGISYHLLSFFGLTEKKRSPRWPRAVRRLIHGFIWVSLAGWVLFPEDSAGRLATGLLGLVLVALAVTAFLWDGRQLFVPWRRHHAHPIVGYIRAAHTYLAVVAAVLLGLGIARATGGQTFPWLLPLGFLTAAGWLSNTILGYLHRILPFLVWHHRYWGRGREPGVPSFRQMTRRAPAWIGFALYNAGVLGVVAALVTPLPLAPGAVLLVAGALTVAGNLLWTF